MTKEEIEESAEIIIKTCLNCRPDEDILVVTDVDQSRLIADCIMSAAHKISSSTGIVVLPQSRVPRETSKSVAEALKVANVVIAIPIGSITYSKALTDALKAGTRFLCGTGMTEDIMKRLIPVDYKEIGKKTSNLAKLLNNAQILRLTAGNGTDLTMKLVNGRARVVDGISHNAGDLDFLPPGTAHLSPMEGTAEGTIVVDGSLFPLGILTNPVKFRVKAGYITRIEGGAEARKFESYLKKFGDPNVYNIAEFGIGTNPAAKLRGIVIEDERTEGAVLIGIGRSLQIGGKVDAKTHNDAIILKTTVELDGNMIIENGKIKL